MVYPLQPQSYSASGLPFPGEYSDHEIKGVGTKLSSIEAVSPHLKESRISLNREHEEKRVCPARTLTLERRHGYLLKHTLIVSQI